MMSEEKAGKWDDCFSFPHLMVYLERSRKVTMLYLDEHGAWQELDAEDAFAELLQHELDHLDGVLSIDRTRDLKNNFCTREEWLRRYRTARA